MTFDESVLIERDMYLAAQIERMEAVGFETLVVLPEAKRIDLGGGFAVDSGRPVALFNGAFCIRWTEAEAASKLDGLIDRFAARGLPFMVHQNSESTPRSLGKLLESRGFVPEEESVLFSCELSSVPEFPPIRAGMRVESVDSLKRTEDFLKVFIEGFGLPASIAEPFNDYFLAYGFGPEKMVQSFVLYDLDRPVAIISTVAHRDPTGQRVSYDGISDDACSVINLAVLPHHRGQGLGMSLAGYAVSQVKSWGYQRLLSTGSPDGMRLYRKCSIQEVGRGRRWTWTPKTVS